LTFTEKVQDDVGDIWDSTRG